ncbi:unnamed protein product [Closterium sp. Naga37s-1]|nr:unnamed protein product [Closterium sp. Naga37s-1]
MPPFMPGRLGWVEHPTSKVAVGGDGGMLWLIGVCNGGGEGLLSATCLTPHFATCLTPHFATCLTPHFATCLTPHFATCLTPHFATCLTPHFATCLTPHFATCLTPHFATCLTPHFATCLTPHFATCLTPHFATCLTPHFATCLTPHLASNQGGGHEGLEASGRAVAAQCEAEVCWAGSAHHSALPRCDGRAGGVCGKGGGWAKQHEGAKR